MIQLFSSWSSKSLIIDCSNSFVTWPSFAIILAALCCHLMSYLKSFHENLTSQAILYEDVKAWTHFPGISIGIHTTSFMMVPPTFKESSIEVGIVNK